MAEVRQEIADFCVGRAHQLAKGAEGKAYEAALESAINLLQTVLEREWDDDHDSIQEAYVERLLDKAIYVSNAHDNEKLSRETAQRAYGLAPDRLRCIVTLAWSTLHRSQQLWTWGEEEASKACITEVERLLLPEGRRLFGDTPQLERIEKHILSLREAHNKGSKQHFAEALKALTRDTPPNSESGRLQARMVEAAMAESEKRYRAAADIYWELLQVTPEDKHMQGKLANCYRSWLAHVREVGDARTMNELNPTQIVTEAKQRCPASPLFDGFDG